jgi:hypothetical protein
MSPADRLREDAVLWTVGEVTTRELVLSACDALVDGLDSQALRLLAGASESTSAFDIDDLLRALAPELGYGAISHGSVEGRIEAARVFAARCVRGELPPRELAGWMHERIRHGHPDRRVEALVVADDEYDTLEYSSQSEAQLDARVVAFARRLLEDVDGL